VRIRCLTGLALSAFLIAGCSADSGNKPGPADSGTGGGTATGGSSGTGGTASGGAAASSGGGAPATGTGGAPVDGGDPILVGCEALCETIASAGCPNGPGLVACVENCVGTANSCLAAQRCYACTGTAPRIACSDAGVPTVPDCPACADISDECAATDASVPDASVPDASLDGSADASNGDASEAKPDAGTERDASTRDASPHTNK